MSLNVWGGRLHEPLLRFLPGVHADVLCLQEVTRTHGATSDWLIYRDGGLELPQRANLFAELCAALPGYDAFFFPAARGPLFDGSNAVASEWGLATFVRRSCVVLGHAVDFVHGDFMADGWGPHPRARNAHAVRLFHDGSTVTVAQMHGLRDPAAAKRDTPDRDKQARAFGGLMRRVCRPGEPLIACGDFNLLPTSRTFAVLAELGLTDLVTSRGFADTRTSHYGKPERHANYMLVTPDVNVLRFDVLEQPEVSDHRALLVESGPSKL